jgi:hypothetical protein
VPLLAHQAFSLMSKRHNPDCAPRNQSSQCPRQVSYQIVSVFKADGQAENTFAGKPVPRILLSGGCEFERSLQ